MMIDLSSIIVAVLALIGTVTGSIVSGNKTQSLIGYRIGELEKKVEKHNSVIERVFKLESDMQAAIKEIDELKEEVKK